MRSAAVLSAVAALASSAAALGINCRGSMMCGSAGFDNRHDSHGDNVMEMFRYALQASSQDNSTMYNSGDHITCLKSGTNVNFAVGQPGAGLGSVEGHLDGFFDAGGICLFAQNLKQPLSLGCAKGLVDAIIDHGCSKCGSAPVHFVDQKSNDPQWGILTFNYVSKPNCIGSCIDPSRLPSDRDFTPVNAVGGFTGINRK